MDACPIDQDSVLRGSPVCRPAPPRLVVALAALTVALALLSAPSAFASAGCEPTGWWPADGTTTDLVSGDSGTLTGGADYAPGHSGQAFDFTSAGDGVTVSNFTNRQTQDFTISAWVKRASTSIAAYDEHIGPGGVVFTYGANGYGFGVFDGGQLFLTKIGISAVVSSAVTVTDTEWHQVAVTKSGSTVTFYVDGIAEQTAPYDPGFSFDTTPAIGDRPDTAAGQRVRDPRPPVDVRTLSAGVLRALRDDPHHRDRQPRHAHDGRHRRLPPARLGRPHRGPPGDRRLPRRAVPGPLRRADPCVGRRAGRRRTGST